MAPLIVITGPTASGKSGLALELARRHNGEIICADSRTVYEGMDIGTAKPTSDERADVPHHGLDVVRPGERFTARDFQELAVSAIADIRARNKVPFLVGGTGLYIDAVVREYQWPAQSDGRDFEAYDVATLQSMLKTQQIPIPANATNRRHLVNALRRQGNQGSALPSPRGETCVVAITTPKDVLHERIKKRAHEMFETGVIAEAQQLAASYGWGSEAMSGNIYPIIRQMLDGAISKDQAIQRFITSDMKLAKRQLTWLRRYDYVTWLSLEEAGLYIETRLREVC